jgi:hypothetical protein
MAPIDLFFCLAALLVGVVAQRVFDALERNERWRRWRMARLQVTRIVDAKPGARVKLRGRAEPLEGLLAAPLSGQQALAWILTLRHTAAGARQKAQREAVCDFRVRDESGEVIVRGARAAVVCTLPAAAPLRTPSPSLARVLDDVGVEKRWIGTRWAPDVAEATIPPRALITLVGVVGRAGGTTIISGDEAAPLYLTPEPEA